MPSSETWDRLVTSALLGTDRAGPLPTLDGPLAALITPATPSLENSLLTMAAALDLFQRAGIVTPSNTSDIPTAPAETLPAISKNSDQHLAMLFTETYQDLLPEFLAACANAGKRITETQLARLLKTVGAPDFESLRPLLPPVLGARGRWLLQQNPAWRNLFDPPTPTDFDTGSRPARLRYLQHLRRTAPAAVSPLLAKSWPQESPEDRADFLALLAVSLSMADEPFLESNLDDKRKEVREIAADLLACLPESRLVQRMLPRIAPCLAAEAANSRLVAALTGKGKLTLRVTLPDTTKDMERDGITGKSPLRNVGEKAWHLARIIAAIPLAHWNLTPAELLPAILPHEFAPAILHGLATAAVRQINIPWSEALLTAWLADVTELDSHHLELTRDLVALFPPQNCEQVLTRLLQHNQSSLERTTRLIMLQSATHPWSPAFSRVVLETIKVHIAQEKNTYLYETRAFIEKHLGLRLHPSIAPSAGQDWPQSANTWEATAKAVETMLALVTVRQNMLKELAP